MSETNLGEYRVVIEAEYENFGAQINSVLKIVQDSANKMSSDFSAMADSVGKSLNEVANSTKTTATMANEQFRTMNESLNKVDASGAAKSVNKLTNEHRNLSPAIDKVSKSAENCGGILSKMGSHMEWLTGAAIVAAILGIPVAINSVAESTEALNAKIRQNLELSDRYHGNNELLNSDMSKLNQTAQTYAVGFGASMTDVQEVMQILSRRFKDVESVSYLTSVALTMSKLDMVDMKKSAQDLEAVMLQFGLSASGTKQFLNDFTIAVHTARITGTDLLDALERSGSAFKAFGMNTRESIAAVAALSTETARAGGTIGRLKLAA